MLTCMLIFSLTSKLLEPVSFFSCNFFRSVEKQFLAFQRGFNLVTSESPLQMMFTPHELEMLICGEKEFDFNELENSTEYDGGFSKETNCVRCEYHCL